MSPLERMTWRGGALLVVDLQEKLIPRIHRRDLIVANTIRLIHAAQAMGMPVWATEQYPKGLGATISEVAALILHRSSKTMFHCCAVPEVVEQIHGRSIRHVTLAGIEAHVCVAQTALELLNMGLRVQIPADAVSSRSPEDAEVALRRLERVGATVSTTEAALFEWVECSDSPHFKTISNLIKEFATPDA